MNASLTPEVSAPSQLRLPLFHPVVLFDGHCLFCSGAVRTLHRMDKEFVFRVAAQQSAEGQALLSTLNVDTHGGSLVVVDGERAYTGSDAGVFILSKLGVGYRLLSGLMRVVPRRLRDAVYFWVARNRYRIGGKSEACFVPDEKLRGRFLRLDR